MRRASERGGGDFGWLNTKHTFSFSDYYDPRWMGFRSLRVINEDYVSSICDSRRIPTATWRSSPAVLRKASSSTRTALGMGSVILPGDGQRMTAGRGIRHSEYNPSRNERVHLYPDLILPEKNRWNRATSRSRFQRKRS